MGIGDIYSKSARGIEEVNERKMKLSSRMRTMLILVDGQVPIFVLKVEAEKVGAAPDFFEELQSLGLIVKTGAVSKAEPSQTQAAPPAPEGEFTRFRLAQEFMNVT